jgi:hypothetical protein
MKIEGLPEEKKETTYQRKDDKEIVYIDHI